MPTSKQLPPTPVRLPPDLKQWVKQLAEASVVIGAIENGIGEIDQLAMLAENNTDDQLSIEVLLKAIRRTCSEMYVFHQELLAISSAHAKEKKT